MYVSWSMKWVHLIINCDIRDAMRRVKAIEGHWRHWGHGWIKWDKTWAKNETKRKQMEVNAKKKITLCRGMCCNLISFLACITCCTFCNTFCDTFKLQLLAASNQRFFRRATSLLESLRNLIEVHCARATVTTVTTARWRQKRHAAICTQPEVW